MARQRDRSDLKCPMQMRGKKSTYKKSALLLGNQKNMTQHDQILFDTCNILASTDSEYTLDVSDIKPCNPPAFLPENAIDLHIINTSTKHPAGINIEYDQ